MKRRNFIKHTAAIAPLIVAFNPVAAAQRTFLNRMMLDGANKDRILVLIEMNGGNDGLNTFIPIDRYNILSIARRNILIPENKILKLDDTANYGFHPAMTGIQKLYNDKLLTVIQGVGYPNPEFSHFRGIDIKYTASTAAESRSGWIGRYLEHQYQGYPKGYPVRKTDGPPAVRVGQVSPRISHGSEEDLGVGFSMQSDYSDIDSGSEDDVMGHNLGSTNIGLIRAISKQVRLYAPVMQDYAKRQETLSHLYPEPEKNALADQLKLVARLIGSGLNTRVYLVNQPGYDTHGDQVDKTDTTKGKHANLLHDLSEAVTAFEDDLHLMGKQDQVLGMTFSEFGRRIASSDSYGTDHGTAETVMLFGTKLKNRIIGASPDLPAKVTLDDNLAFQYDFRSLYRSVMKDWLGVPKELVATLIPQGPDTSLDLFAA